MAIRVESAELFDGLVLQYAEQGEASGVPVLLLHGLSDSWRSYEPVVRALPPWIRAIVPSLRGHGDSTRSEGGYAMRDFAADLAALLDALGIERAVAAGHSLGANAAQRFAVDYPDRLRGLVLVGSAPVLAGKPALRELWDAVVSTMEDPVDPGFVREFQQSTLARPVSPEFLEAVVQESLKLPARVWRAVLAEALEVDQASELARIGAPTLLVWGARDELCLAADQDAQLAAIADCRLVVYEGAGHAPHWEEPDRFAADLASFVEAVGERTGRG